MTNALRVKIICETKKVLELTGFEDVKHKYLYSFIIPVKEVLNNEKYNQTRRQALRHSI